MKEEQKDRFFDLLTSKVIRGLDEDAQRELDEFDSELADLELRSLEKTAAAISLIDMDTSEAIPSHLYARILDGAEDHLKPLPSDPAQDSLSVHRDRDPRAVPWFAWLGWAVAAAACVALAVNVIVLRPGEPDVARVDPPNEAPRVFTPAESREEMIRSAPGMIQGQWAPGNVKNMKSVSGDVVWSDEMQAGYMRLRGLPMNDKATEQYQLWIFDKTQDKATPIDGGTFDVTSEGEVVIPITAKLRARSPEMFAVTIEKPGGVVVSSREKIAAIAKVETRSS